MGGRAQATIFLPSAVAGAVDDVRWKWDPTMARRIAPHVTVLHHARSLDELRERLEGLAPTLAPFRLHLGYAARWRAPDHGLYLTVDDCDHGIARLRNLLTGVAAREPAVSFTPHVTLVHFRTTYPSAARSAWEELSTWRIDLTIPVEEIAVVESTSVSWVTTGTYRLGQSSALTP